MKAAWFLRVASLTGRSSKRKEKTRKQPVEACSQAASALLPKPSLYKMDSERRAWPKKPVTTLCKLCPELQTEASSVYVSEAKGKIFCTGTRIQIHTLALIRLAENGQCISAEDKIQVFSLHGSYPNYTKVRCWFETEELVMSNFSEATRLCLFVVYLKKNQTHACGPIFCAYGRDKAL